MKKQLREIIESLIFVSLEPLTLEKLKTILAEYIQIIQTAGGYLFTTKPDYDQWISRLFKEERKNRLSSAALETLSIIAYHQPVTLAEISSLRGVDTTHTLKVLLEKKLVKIVGRKKGPGRPLIYRTTDRFLSHFGLNSLKDLPSQEEISKIIEKEQAIED